jgi:PAS domain S-box-containing protein
MNFNPLWDGHPDVMFVMGPAGVIVDSNLAAQRLGLLAHKAPPPEFSLAAATSTIRLSGLTFQVVVGQSAAGQTLVTARQVPEPAQAGRERDTVPSDKARRLSSKRELLASVLDQMGEGVAAADTEGQILVWNAAAVRITKLPTLQSLAETDGLELRNTKAVPCESALRRALKGQEIDGEEQFVRHAGLPEGVWMTVTARPMRDENGVLTGAVAVFRDSTVQRQLNETLGQARDAALQATRLKSEFLANMSHEIRTPLNGIIGLGDLLALTDLDQAQREYVSTVRLCSASLLSIVNDVLDFSKIEAGKSVLEREPFELEGMVEEALELAATSLGDKPVEMFARLGPELPRLLVGDHHRLRQILLNYLSNAVKFTSEGEVVVDVELAGEAQPDSVELRFFVHDTGSGVETSAQKLLFEPFSQADSSSKRVHGGTGLGLAICRSLAELMGGEAGFCERQGGGSTFFFKVRLGLPPTPAFPITLHDLPPIAVSLPNPVLRLAVKNYLQERGAQVGEEVTPAIRVLILDDRVDLRPLSDPAIDLRVICLGREQRPDWSGGHLNFLRKPLKFSRLLRLLREVAGNAHDSGKRATLSLPLPTRRLTGRVLVAEDNPINRRVLLLMLEKMGLQAKGAENGAEAAEAALSGEYDLVLMDCQMPVMDGHEATRLVRERWTSGSRLPIIAVTANAMEGEADRCRQSGMDDYLAKPVTVETLRGVVERWLSVSD